MGDVANALVQLELERKKRDEIASLGDLISRLFDELSNGQLTTAQRIGALSEIRKCIQFRCVLLGLVDAQQYARDADAPF